MTTVRGKTAVVTGGANGIGYQYSQQLLRNGARAVAIFDLPNSKGATSASTLNEEFGTDRALWFPVDVTNSDQLEEVFKDAVKALGGLDILINNAGIMNDFEYEKMIAINFTAVVKSTLLGYDYMGTHKGGKGGIIVNVSSVVGLITLNTIPVYTATKHAVVAFTVSLKDSYERTGVSVRVMCPGVTDTPLITDAKNEHLDFIDGPAAVNYQLGLARQPSILSHKPGDKLTIKAPCLILPVIRAEHVGKAMIELIEKAANGAVWVSQHSKPPIKVDLPKYDRIKY